MATITTPVKGFTGRVAGVSFVDGVGETASPGALAYFRRHGYGIDDQPTEAKPVSKMNVGELRDHAKAIGVELPAAAKKPEILEAIKAADAGGGGGGE